MDLVDSSLTARPAPAAPSQTDSTSQPPVTTRNGAAQGTTASASGITARAAANQGAAAPAIDPRQKQKGEAKTARIPIKIIPIKDMLRKPDWIRKPAPKLGSRFYEMKEILATTSCTRSARKPPARTSANASARAPHRS